MIKVIPKKSFNFADLDEYKIKYFIIPQKKLKTNYRYDIHHMLVNVTELAFNIQREKGYDYGLQEDEVCYCN